MDPSLDEFKILLTVMFIDFNAFPYAEVLFLINGTSVVVFQTLSPTYDFFLSYFW